MSEQTPVIEALNLSAGYGAKEVLSDFNFSISQGEWVVLLGPNGSGKSTLLKSLTGVVIPSDGEAKIFGCNSCIESIGIRNDMAYLPEDYFLYPELNSRQHLAFIIDIFKMDKKQGREYGEKLLEQLGLKDAGNQPVSSYSQGMKRKLILAMGLLHKPKLLIMDEPFNGLDPVISNQLREGICKLCKEHGTTVLMSTHNLGMAHKYADRLLIIYEGKLLFKDSPEKLLLDYPDMSLEEVFINMVGANCKLELSL